MIDIEQYRITLNRKLRGFHIITDEIYDKCNDIRIFEKGIINIHLLHTSASLSINENADPTVREDMESFFNRIVPEDDLSLYKHIYEGADDMTSHIKNSILGSTLNVSISNGKLNLGRWQGIYLCEHRNNSSERNLVITIIGKKYEE